MYINCHVVIFAETMDQQRDFEQEEILGDIIRDGRDVMSFLNDIEEGLQGEEAGYGDQTVEEESHDHDGGSGDRDDGFGDQTESG